MQALRETDPRHIGPYAVLGRLGAGGMGEVYLAEAPGGPRLAVKVVRAEYAEDRTFRARFRQEVRAARSVGGSGSYVARVVDSDTEGERPWMATEFVEGPNLRDAVLDHGPLPPAAVRLLAGALCEALTAVHAEGLVHRDLKPSNILLASDGPRIIDFGIVRALEATALTRTGIVVGSVGYVAPEQIRRDGQVGPPCDVFALGAVLAYAAAGHEPFGEGQDAVILMRILNQDFDLSPLPADLRGLIEPCLRAEPVERPTPGEVLSAVGHTPGSLRESLRSDWYTSAGNGPGDEPDGAERWLPERDSGERESRVEYVAPVTVMDVPTGTSRRRLLQILAAGGLVAAGAGTGAWLWLRDRSPRSPTLAWRRADGVLADTGSGPCAALSPDGGTLYFGGGERLHAVTPAGERLWATDLGLPVHSPLATADGAYCLAGPSTSADPTMRVCAVDTKGRVRWRDEVAGQDGTVPVAAGDLVLVTLMYAGLGGVRAYRPDGTVAWEQSGIGREPLVAGDVVHLPTQDDTVAARSATDGTLIWETYVGESPGRPALVGRTLIVGCDGGENVHGLSLTGKELWGVGNTDVGAIARAESGTYTDFTTFGTLAVTTHLGPVVAVSPQDGSTAWRFPATGEVRQSTGPAVHDSTLYVLVDGTLYALDGAGGTRHTMKSTERAPLTTAHRPVATPHPSGRGARLYVAGGDGLMALDLPG